MRTSLQGKEHSTQTLKVSIKENLKANAKFFKGIGTLIVEGVLLY